MNGNVFNQIKTEADKQGMTIKELERRAGLSDGAIGKWRNCTPRFDNLIKVTKVLSISIDSLQQ